MTKAELYRKLEGQLNDPNHCHVEVVPGRLWRHSRAGTAADKGDQHSLTRMWGHPVRFTRLAAEALVATLNRTGGRARVVPLGGLHHLLSPKESVGGDGGISRSAAQGGGRN